MRTPLLGIRIQHSESPMLHRGQQFDTIADFDAVVRAARLVSPCGRVGFVLTWKDGATFHGVHDLELPERLVDHVARVCRLVLLDPRRLVLLRIAQLTLQRLFAATLAERLAGLTRPVYSQEAPCRTAAG